MLIAGLTVIKVLDVRLLKSVLFCLVTLPAAEIDLSIKNPEENLS